MWRLFRDIITKRFATLSRKIRASTDADTGFRTLCLLTLIIATPRCSQGGDIIPRVHSSWRRRYPGRGGPAELLYLGYSGNPWGTSSLTGNQDHKTRFFWQPQSILTSRNDSKPTEAAMRPGINSSLKRSKRSVVHLYNMVLCATGCNPLAYKGYGCYCGFLGSGFTVDGIDRCCKMHDWCYEATDCPMFLEYFVPYYWKCYRGNKPICAVEHGDWGGSGSCPQRLCECDRALAECLRRYPCPNTKAMCTSSPWRLVQNLFMLM